MHKHIILFSDGTGNSAAKLFRTNVWRVYQAVDLADPADSAEPRQFALYDDGVGSSTFRPLALLGGALGLGLARNVRDLYRFVCRIYQPGDRIYAFGFSRGAFTIRVLVGFMLSQGLVPYRGSEAELERLSKAAYRRYRHGYTTWLRVEWPLRKLRDGLAALVDALLGRKRPGDVAMVGGPDAKPADQVKIQFVGVWDTVDAYGLPIGGLTRVVNKLVWPIEMRDYELHQNVLHARHALSIDDERSTFHPRLWNEAPNNEGEADRIVQLWFAGVHTNVGGGYPDDSLSRVSLEWMMDAAEAHGLRYSDPLPAGSLAASDENGPIYDSRRGLAGYYRYLPRRIEKLTTAKVKVHESVLRRIKAGHDGYAPIALPTNFDVVKLKGGVQDASDHLAWDDAARAGYTADRERVYRWVHAREAATR